MGRAGGSCELQSYQGSFCLGEPGQRLGEQLGGAGGYCKPVPASPSDKKGVCV